MANQTTNLRVPKDTPLYENGQMSRTWVIFLEKLGKTGQSDYDRATFIVADSTPGVDVANHLAVRRPGTLASCVCVPKIPPVGVDFVADIKANGKSLFGTSKPTVPAGSSVLSELAVFSAEVARVEEDDILTLDITSSDGVCEITLMLQWRVD